ncbi:hypothetical protein T265_16007, partial [Opisthorchis viverrini]
MEHERDRLESENQRLRCTEGDSRRSTVDSSAGMEALVRENEAIKSKLKEGDRRLRHLAREVALIGSIERDHEWIEKYNDARETIKEQEIQLSRSKKRVAELQDENARLRADERKVEQRSRRAQEKGSSTPHMSREALAHEIKSLEEELVFLTYQLLLSSLRTGGFRPRSFLLTVLQLIFLRKRKLPSQDITCKPS